MKWFERGHKPWPSEEYCARIAAQLEQRCDGRARQLPAIRRRRVVADQIIPRTVSPGISARALIKPIRRWNPQEATARAKALLNDVPAMLWFWHGMQKAPEEIVPGQLDGIELPEVDEQRRRHKVSRPRSATSGRI